MPNPTDAERQGDAGVRSGKLLSSAGATANAKKSWSEWFGVASNSWLGSYGADKASGAVSETAQGAIAAKFAATALGTALAGITGFWVVAAAGAVTVEIVAKKLEDKAKDAIPGAVAAARGVVGRFFFGGGPPDLELNADIKKGAENHTLEETMERIKTNSALLQDLLNKLAGAAGKPYYCDDAYQIGALAQKCAGTKGELLRDIGLMSEFMTQLRADLDKIDPATINDKVKDLAKAICDVNDGRHWDNSWGAATVKRMFRCSKEHCFGPK